MDELAELTEGYSGSDLKNLCVAAAYRPIRELLKNEAADRATATTAATITAPRAAAPDASQQTEADAPAPSISESPTEANAASRELPSVPAAETDAGAVAGAAGAVSSRGNVVARSTADGAENLHLKKGGAEKDCRGEGVSEPTVQLRSITMADVKAAMEQVGPSVAQDASSTTDLRQWNEKYGEGGSRKATTLSYYT